MSDSMTAIDYICSHVSREARLLQLAEECAELSKACLKLHRALTHENPTPQLEGKLEDDLLEEAVDVLVCMEAAGVDYLEGVTLRTWGSDRPQMLKERKLARWVQRLVDSQPAPTRRRRAGV